MNTTTRTTMAAYAVLLLAGGVSVSIPVEKSIPSAQAGMLGGGGDVVYLTGTVRDFRTDHADFEVNVGANAGHYAGNVVYDLPGDSRPVFDGDGFQVRSEWTDATLNRIAPHMYMNGDTVRLNTGPREDRDVVIDSWDSSRGAYGGGNIGPRPNIQTGASMPKIREPRNLPANEGDVNYRDIVTINRDIHCDTFQPRRDTVLRIEGDVTIFCEVDFIMNQLSHITLNAGASLKIYARGLIQVSRGSTVNMNTMQPWRCQIYNLGATTVEINQSSAVCGQIFSPDAGLHLAQNDHFYGYFVGQTIGLDQSSQFHADTGPLMDACGGALEDIAGTSGGVNKGAITSVDTYSQWYRNVLGTNLAAHHTIALTRNGHGVYEYIDPAFLPIDGKLFGNEGATHNYNFTYLVSAEFTFDSCTNQFVEFEGADDAWLFIDGQMVLDIAGITPNTNQHIGLDRLGLEDGETYTFTLYYAQRQSVQAAFGLRTNLDLARSSNLPTASPEFD